MAALDFGMALARGMLPMDKDAQADLVNRAGGRSVFKSEDWWQQQVDKQIDKGITKPTYETVTEYLARDGKTMIPGIRKTYPRRGGGPLIVYERPPSAFLRKGRINYSIPAGAPEGLTAKLQPRGGVYFTREFQKQVGTKQADFTKEQLSDIEESAASGAEKSRRLTAEPKAARKRLKRGTGGLVSKARLPGDKPSTGLPELGTTGLGMTAGLFGADIKL